MLDDDQMAGRSDGRQRHPAEQAYRNLRNGTFKEAGVQAGVAFSADGQARAGMGIDAAD